MFSVIYPYSCRDKIFSFCFFQGLVFSFLQFDYDMPRYGFWGICFFLSSYVCGFMSVITFLKSLAFTTLNISFVACFLLLVFLFHVCYPFCTHHWLLSLGQVTLCLFLCYGKGNGSFVSPTQ